MLTDKIRGQVKKRYLKGVTIKQGETYMIQEEAPIPLSETITQDQKDQRLIIITADKDLTLISRITIRAEKLKTSEPNPKLRRVQVRITDLQNPEGVLIQVGRAETAHHGVQVQAGILTQVDLHPAVLHGLREAAVHQAIAVEAVQAIAAALHPDLQDLKAGVPVVEGDSILTIINQE